MYYQVDDDTRARVCVRVSVLCVCLCMCVFEPTQPLQREFNYDMGSRIKKKRKKKKRKKKSSRVWTTVTHQCLSCFGEGGKTLII